MGFNKLASLKFFPVMLISSLLNNNYVIEDMNPSRAGLDRFGQVLSFLKV